MIKLITGDVLECLAKLPDESVQTVVTSPPYWGLRDYGVDGQIGLEKTPEEYVAAMVRVFAEVRRVLRTDGTCWMNLGDSYATQSPIRSRNQVGYGSRPKDHPLTPRPSEIGLKPKDLVGIPWRVAFALQADGWWLALRHHLAQAEPDARIRPRSAHKGPRVRVPADETGTVFLRCGCGERREDAETNAMGSRSISSQNGTGRL